jgi:hypothetical protein
MKSSRCISSLLILGVVSAMVIFGQVSPGRTADYHVTKITADDYGGFAFNGHGHVAWGGSFNVTYKVWLYRANNDLIYSGSHIMAHLNMNDLDQVVWDNFATTSDIYLYSGGASGRITFHEITNTYNTNPQINNQGDIAYVQASLAGTSVLLLKGGAPHYASPSFSEISSDGLSLNNLGQVVWSQRKNIAGEKFQIYFYDGVNTLPLTSDVDGDNLRPLINDRGDIIWTHKTGAGGNDLRHYRAETYTTITSSLHVSYQNYALNNLGEIAWMAAGPNPGQNLYVHYDGTNHRMANTKIFPDVCPALNDRGKVAYAVQNRGVALTDYRAGTTIFLGGIGPGIIKLNQRSQVAWQEAVDLAYCNLYLATPPDTLPAIQYLLLGNEP